MIHELDIIILTHDIPGSMLKRGSKGTVVHCYEDDQAYEVEFINSEGKTIALLTLQLKDIRPLIPNRILKIFMRSSLITRQDNRELSKAIKKRRL